MGRRTPPIRNGDFGSSAAQHEQECAEHDQDANREERCLGNGAREVLGAVNHGDNVLTGRQIPPANEL